MQVPAQCQESQVNHALMRIPQASGATSVSGTGMRGELPAGTGHAGHRPDIQGLRALAVLAVVLYHAHLPGLPGGFAGVDIFFVLSGYLICGLLHRELGTAGTINLSQFWLRRARRLLPNACLTLLATLTASTVILPGYALPAVAGSVAAAALYAANLYFAAKANDYFADAEAPNPALHFWSLSLEEQFYIAWPLLLTAVARVMRRDAIWATAWLTGAVWVVSFALSVTAIRFDQPLAFYHGEMRAWELATGGLLALAMPMLMRLPWPARGAVGWLGLGGVVASLVWLDSAMRWPGALALLPTLSTAALLAAGGAGPARMLSLRPLQWLGDRSYSLYLWHWPALVLTAAALPQTPMAAPLGLAVGAACAFASYEWVEQPFRSGHWHGAPVWRTCALVATGIAAVLAGSLALQQPFWSRNAASAAITRELKTAANDHGRNYFDHCHLTLDEVRQPDCVYGAKGSPLRAALLGDSHASQWFAALDVAARKGGWRLDAWTKSSCPAIEAALWYPPRRAAFTACAAWREEVLVRLTGPDHPARVFLASRTDYEGYILDPETGALAGRARADTLWRAGFSSVIQRLRAAGIDVVVIRDTPKAAKTYADCLSSGRGGPCDRLRSQALAEPSPDVAVAGDIAGVRVLDLSDAICGASSCPLLRNGQVIYLDWNHLRASFAATLAGAFAPFLPAATDPRVAAVDRNGTPAAPGVTFVDYAATSARPSR